MRTNLRGTYVCKHPGDYMSLKRSLRSSTSERLDKAWSQHTVISHRCHLGHDSTLPVVNYTLIVFFIFASNLTWQGKLRHFIVASKESIFHCNIQRIWIETGTIYPLHFFLFPHKLIINLIFQRTPLIIYYKL